MRVSSLRAVALLAAAALSSTQCGSKTPKQVAGGITPVENATGVAIAAEVQITQYAFRPETVRIAVGGIVRWTNRDNVGHTVTFTAADTTPRRPIRSRAELMALNRPSELYSSKLFTEGQTFMARFDQPGRFGYICDPHPYMKAIVIVQ